MNVRGPLGQLLVVAAILTLFPHVAVQGSESRLGQGSGLGYSSFIGAHSDDFGSDIAVDGSGAAYVLSFSYSGSDFPTTPGAFDTTNEGGDAVVSKFSADGSQLVWSTFLGGTGAECQYGCALEVDSVGAVFVTGSTASTDFPVTDGAFDPEFNGSSTDFTDAFLAKLSPAGTTLEYATYLGGSHRDAGREVTVDGDGNAYVTGTSSSANFPTTTGAFDTTCADCASAKADVFVTKVDATGSALVYSTFLGGSGTVNDSSEAIRVDSAGSAYVTGTTYADDFPTTAGALDRQRNAPGSGDSSDGFVTKLSSSGSGLVYSTFLGGGYHDGGTDLRVDGSGAAYVAGTTRSGDFPTTSGAFDTTCGCDHEQGDAFVAKLDGSGSSLEYGTFLGGEKFNPDWGNIIDDHGAGIAIDDRGAATVVGGTNAHDFPITADAFDSALDDGYRPVGDAFIARLSATGTGLEYASYLGGSRGGCCFPRGLDGASAVAADSAGDAYLTGDTRSENFPVTSGAYDTTFNSLNEYYADTFVTKFTFGGGGGGSHTLTVTRAGTGRGKVSSSPAGINCGSDCTEDYAPGTEVTLTARAARDSSFAGWSGACSGTASTCTVTMDAAKSVTATFTSGSSGTSHTLSVTKSGTGKGGVMSDPAGIKCGSDCSEDYPAGTSVTLTAKAASGSTFTGWSGACSGAASTCTLTMDAAKSVTATFNSP